MPQGVLHSGIPALVAVLHCVAVNRTYADEVEYEVTFEATWSATTHPEDFPPGPHFSGLIGGTHNGNVTFWEVGELASNGIEQMAELGSKTALQNEVNATITAGDALSVLSGGGIAPSPGSVSLQFTISDTHPLVTLVSMIAPSPDWFVGVSGLNLRDGNQWRQTVVVDLDPYDAGTDSGVTYLSADDDTQPPDPITNLSNTFPFTGTPPLGTFTFELLTPQPEAIPATGVWSLLILALIVLACGSVQIKARA